MPAMEVVDTEPAFATKLRALVLEEVRRCRRSVVKGWENPEPAFRRCGSETWAASVPDALADVEEALDTTEEFWAARRRDNSRVKRLTTASCSFSSSRWRSAAVRGLGCRMGPSPGPIAELSAGTGPARTLDGGK